MKTACPHCGSVFSVRDDLANKQVRCRNCKGLFVIAPQPVDEGIRLRNSDDDAPATSASESSQGAARQADIDFDGLNLPLADFPAIAPDPIPAPATTTAPARQMSAAPIHQPASATVSAPEPREPKSITSFNGNESAIRKVLVAYALTMLGVIAFALLSRVSVQRILLEELLLGIRIFAAALAFWGALKLAGRIMAFRTRANGLLGAWAIVALPIIPASIAQVAMPDSVWTQWSILLGIAAGLAMVFVGYGLDLTRGAVTAGLGTVLSLVALLVIAAVISTGMGATSEDYNDNIFPWTLRYAVLHPGDGTQTASDPSVQPADPARPAPLIVLPRPSSPATPSASANATPPSMAIPVNATGTPSTATPPAMSPSVPLPYPSGVPSVAAQPAPSIPVGNIVPGGIAPPSAAPPAVTPTLSAFATIEDWTAVEEAEQVISSTPAGPYFATVSNDRLGNAVIDVWSLPGIEKKGTIKLGGGKNVSYALSSAGDMLLRVNQTVRPTAEVWSVATGERMNQIPLNAINGDGAALGFADKNTIAVLWKKMRDFGIELIDLKRGQVKRQIAWRAGITMFDYDCNPQNVVFTPDGKQIALVNGQMHLELVDLATGTKKKDWFLDIPDPHTNGVSSTVFSADGKRIAVVVDFAGSGAPSAIFHGQMTDKELTGIIVPESLYKQAGLQRLPQQRFGRMADWLDAGRMLLYGQLILDVNKGALVDTVYAGPDGRPAGKGAGAQIPLGAGRWLLERGCGTPGGKGPMQLLTIDATRLQQ